MSDQEGDGNGNERVLDDEEGLGEQEQDRVSLAQSALASQKSVVGYVTSTNQNRSPSDENEDEEEDGLGAGAELERRRGREDSPMVHYRDFVRQIAISVRADCIAAWT